MRTYTIEDFRPSTYGDKPITEQAWFQYGGLYDNSINYSSILTRLIQEAGRWCERFASDLFIDWNHAWSKITSLSPDSDNLSFLFGFREAGVDHTEWVLARHNESRCPHYEYRKIYRLDAEIEGEAITLKLYAVSAT